MAWWLIFVFLLVLLVVGTGAVTALWMLLAFLYTRVPYVKTPRASIDALLKKVKITSHDIVVDIGCGDAEVLCEIEKRTGARTIGFELSPTAYLKARMNILKRRCKTKVYFKDFRKADLTDATVIFCFLIVGVMKQVGIFLAKRARPGALVVSYGYEIPSWQPVEVITTSGTSYFYLYRVPQVT